MTDVIYLDHNASTPPDPRVLEAMLPYHERVYANPSSLHALGRTARAAVERAREQVAALLNTHPSQVIFTSGGSEANNTAIKGYALGRSAGRVAVSAVEHASVLAPAHALTRLGWAVDAIPADSDGQVSAAAVSAALQPQTQLVSVMLANNETGVVNDIAAIAETVRAAGAILHTDVVQAVGKQTVDFARCGAHMMSLSAHKLHGPKGIGALVVDKALELEPLVHGGGQEKNRRGGTENLAGIVGFGVAAELALAELEVRRERMTQLRAYLESELGRAVPEAVIFATRVERLPNTVFLALPGIEGPTLLLELDRQGIAVSAGAACGSEYREPSHVLKAMGVPLELARCAIRVSLGPLNTEPEIDALIDALRKQSLRLRAMAATAWA